MKEENFDYYEFDVASNFNDIIDDISKGCIKGVNLQIIRRDETTAEIKGEGIEFSIINQPLERTETQGFETKTIDDGLILIEIDRNLDPNHVFMILEEYYRGHIAFIGR